MTWQDVSTPLRDGMPVYPGDPPVRVRLAQALARGDDADLTALELGAHAGTHVDAPAHALPGGAGVDALDPSALIGAARVVDAAGDGPIGAGDAALAAARGCTRLLLRTGHGRDWPPRESRGLDVSGAEEVVRHGVRLVGIDAMSIAPDDDPMPPHRVLLRAGVVIVEGLDLRRVAAGDHLMVCLPLLVPGADGAPARVLLAPPGTAL